MDVYLKLEEKEAQFIARELHHLVGRIDVEKVRIRKAVQIGNKIAEQLSEQRDLPQILGVKIIRETTMSKQQSGPQKARRGKKGGGKK